MKNPIHSKKKTDTTPKPDENAAAPQKEFNDVSSPGQPAGEEAATAPDVDIETENLKNAIAQVMAEETAVLPHIEQLSSSVTKESGFSDDNTGAGPDASETGADASGSDPDSAESASKVRKKAKKKSPAVPDGQAKISSWFVTFMAMRIPLISWVYLLYLAFSKNTVNRRNFARAYLLIKLIFLVLGLIILLILISTAMNILEDLLDYMAML